MKTLWLDEFGHHHNFLLGFNLYYFLKHKFVFLVQLIMNMVNISNKKTPIARNFCGTQEIRMNTKTLYPISIFRKIVVVANLETSYILIGADIWKIIFFVLFVWNNIFNDFAYWLEVQTSVLGHGCTSFNFHQLSWITNDYQALGWGWPSQPQ